MTDSVSAEGLREALQEAYGIGYGDGAVGLEGLGPDARLDRIVARYEEGRASAEGHRYDHDGMHRHHHEYGPTGRAIWWEYADQFGGDLTEHTHADRASADGLREALRDLLNYESVHPLTGGNKTRLEAVRAALHSSESDNRIDVERLARALWGINFERPEIFRLATDIARRYEAEGPHDAAGKIAAEYARLYTPRTETNDSTCHCSCDADHNESDHRP